MTDRSRHRARRITVAGLGFRLSLSLSSDQSRLGGDSQEEDGEELHAGLDWTGSSHLILLLFDEKYQEKYSHCTTLVQELKISAGVEGDDLIFIPTGARTLLSSDKRER